MNGAAFEPRTMPGFLRSGVGPAAVATDGGRSHEPVLRGGIDLP